MDAIMMDKNDQRIYTLATDVLYGKLTIKEFSTLVGKSYRQSQRIVRRIQKSGLLALRHGNSGKRPWNKISNDLKAHVLDLYFRYYNDFNLTHFLEKLRDEHGLRIKRETMRKWATERDYVKRPKRRRPRKAHPPRPRMPQEGLLVQFDGSEHAWFGKDRPIYTLIGGIDDASGEVLHLEFYPAEDTFNCMDAMKKIIQKKGVPMAFYLDRAGHFGKPYSDQDHTQIGRALQELDCKIILAGTPQAKGRIERLWGTLQDRLVAELRLHNIRTVRRANEFLKNEFLNDYNLKFSQKPRRQESAYRSSPSPVYLERVFCLKEKRRITSGNVFSFNGIRYSIREQEDFRYKFITTLSYPDGRIEFELMGKDVRVAEIGVMEENPITTELRAA